MIPKNIVVLFLLHILSYANCKIDIHQYNSYFISNESTSDAWVFNTKTVVTSTNIVRGGYFKGTVYFGTTSKTPTPSTAQDLFLVSFDRSSNGTQTVVTLGGTAPDVLGGFAVDSNGEFVLSSFFSGTTNYGGNTLISSTGDSMALIKLYSNFTHKWSFSFGGNSSVIVTGLAVDSNNNILVVGRFQGTANWGGTSLTSNGLFDCIIGKYSPTGAHLWSQSFGSTAQDGFSGVAADASGNVIAAGYFSGSMLQGSTNVTLQGTRDPLIIKMDTNGNTTWYKNYLNTGSCTSSSVAVDSADNILVAGGYDSIVNFGGTNLTNSGINDVFLIKLNPNSSLVWQQKLGSTGSDISTSVSMDTDDNSMVMAGYYQYSPTVGQVTLPNTTGAAYAMKFTSSGSALWGASYPGPIWTVEAATMPNSNDTTISVSYTTSLQDLNNQTCPDNGALTCMLAVIGEVVVADASPSPSPSQSAVSPGASPSQTPIPGASPTGSADASASPSSDTADSNGSIIPLRSFLVAFLLSSLLMM